MLIKPVTLAHVHFPFSCPKFYIFTL